MMQEVLQQFAGGAPQMAPEQMYGHLDAMVQQQVITPGQAIDAAAVPFERYVIGRQDRRSPQAGSQLSLRASGQRLS